MEKTRYFYRVELRRDGAEISRVDQKTGEVVPVEFIYRSTALPELFEKFLKKAIESFRREGEVIVEPVDSSE